MFRRIEIGQSVTFRDRRQATRQGRVVGSEVVTPGDLLKRSPGRWLLVRCSDESDCHQVPEASIAGPLERG